MGILARFRQAIGGNIGMTFGLVAVPLVTAIGVGVDYARTSDVRSHLQSAVDASALAGRMKEGDLRNREAQAVFDAQLGKDRVTGATAAFRTNGDGSFTVTAAQRVPNTIMQMFGQSHQNVSAEATAQRGAGTPPTGGDGCFLLIDRGAPNGLILNSLALVDGARCEAHVHSAGQDAFILNSATRLAMARVCVRGGTTLRGSYGSTRIEPGCNPAPDPYAARMPAIPAGGCTFTNLVINPVPTVTLSPGTYCGDMNINGRPDRIIFQPGLYVIQDGAFNLSAARIEGDGVTFVLAGTRGRFQMNGMMAVDLRAPTAGPYTGILFQGASTLTRAVFVWNAQLGQRIRGLIYLPTLDMHMNVGPGGLERDQIALVAQTMIVNALTDWRFEPMPNWTFGTGAGVGAAGAGTGMVRLIR